jgi:EpsI family protein
MVLMVPLAVVGLFGLAWGRILAFPLAFLLFSVPFGEALTPTLIDWTADFTVAALRAVGIPVLREGPHFVIPSGRWSVVEACSGIRYLMASVVVGTLYAWSVYRSPLRRALFIAASFIVPILANWVRAFLIVLTGHLSSNRLAVGIDHIIYGWVFFGLVIGAMFWIGLRWREDDAERRAAPSLAATGPSTRLRPSAAMLTAIVALVAVWPLGAFALLGMTDKRPLQPVAFQPNAGWTQESQPVGSWTPQLQGRPVTQSVTFTRNGARVTLVVAWYRDQHQDHELVNAMNRLLPEGERAMQIARGGIDTRFGDRPATVRTATVRHDAQRLRIWQWYWIDDRIETSDTRAKLSLALDRLLARSDTSAWVAAFVEAETDAQGDQVLAGFAREMGPALTAALAATSAR